MFRQVPYNDVRYNATELEFNEAHLAVARKAATEAMTLYKNEKDTLPLSDTKVKKLAIIGPQGDNAGLLFGNYAGSANGGNWGMSIAAALKARLSGSGGTVMQVSHAPANQSHDDSHASDALPHSSARLLWLEV